MAYVSEDNRAMLRAVHWDIPLQTVFDQKLVLGKLMPIEEMDSLAWRQLLIDNDDADNKILEPGKWDVGTDFPEVGVSELAYQSGVIDGLGIMVKFDAKRIYYNDGVLDIQDAQRRILRKWAKKVERDIASDVTGAFYSTTDGGQFNSVLTEATGGISAGTQKNWLVKIDSGKSWDKEGDAIQQMREYATSMTAANRLASLGGDMENDPRTTTVFLDPLAYGALHDQLRDADVTTHGVGVAAITVPSLYGLTFTVADYALTTTGEAVGIDTAAQPYVYKQSLPPIPGFSRIGLGAAGGEKDKIPGQGPGASAGIQLLVRDDDAMHGGVEVRFAHLGKSIVRKPKSITFFKGTHS